MSIYWKFSGNVNGGAAGLEPCKLAEAGKVQDGVSS